MEILHVKTNGGVSPKDKPRIYFSCHREDFEARFAEVSNYLLSAFDCAIYYYQGEPVVNDLFYSDLKRAHLFVVPVTMRLLTTQNRTMDTELPFVLKHNIPVLPFLMEPKLDTLYAQRFGALHYLNPKDQDATALPFADKLRSYLESALFDNELIARIRAEFDATMFLSYRKSDRIHAQELMQRIHQIPQCRDVAFWYDEFLTAGRDFNLEIESSIADCDVFALVMTPRLLIPGNYVLKNELPAAMVQSAQRGLEILAVEMEEVDPQELRSSGLGMFDLLSPKDQKQFSDRVVCALDPQKLGGKNSDEHDFLIGVAYLYGIDLEVDQDRGLDLILRSAHEGNTEAMEMLADIYQTGNGVKQDLVLCEYWLERLVSLAREAYERCQSEHLADIYVQRCCKLFVVYLTSLEYQKCERLYNEAAPILGYWKDRSDDDRFLTVLMWFCQMLEYQRRSNSPLAIRSWGREVLKLDRELLRSKDSVDAMDQVNFYLKKASRHMSKYAASDHTVLDWFIPDFMKHGFLFGAQYYQYKAFGILSANDDPDGSYHQQKLSKLMDDIGAVWERLAVYDEAKRWHNRALQIRLRYRDDPNPAVEEDLATGYFNLGCVYSSQVEKIRSDFFYSLYHGSRTQVLMEEGRAALKKALELQKEMLEKKNTSQNRRQLSLIYYRIALLEQDVALMEKAYLSMRELAEQYPEIHEFRLQESLLNQELRALRRTAGCRTNVK